METPVRLSAHVALGSDCLARVKATQQLA